MGSAEEYQSFIADDTSAGLRLDVAASQEIDGLSRSRVQALIKCGDILVNGKAAKPGYMLQLGDTVSTRLGEPACLDIRPEDIPLNIVYEDNDIAVIDKPKGMVVHPAPGHSHGTLVNALLHRFAHSLSGINGVMRPGIVHRIDKDTSGLLVVAKSDHAHQSLSVQLAAHTIKREYLAIATGNIKPNTGTVDRPIGRHPIHRKKMAVVPSGRHAVTHYTVIERSGRHTYIRLQLTTGRTHQIRVHMASIGHPILGDEVYNPTKPPHGLGTGGQVLHAHTLGFAHPQTGKILEFESQIPLYFQRVLLAMGLDNSAITFSPYTLNTSEVIT
ncbi:MAG: RluA family pseudouridine synthase [Defluviitaleaceae bacterium]|nr:RluA family pseudouridine synthase [Defluviitaleaceae bacterium]